MSMNHGAEFAPIEMITDSWETVKTNAGPLIGGCLLVVIIIVGAGAIPFANLVVQGPLQFGLYAVALRAVRGQSVEFPEIFSGFQRFVPTFVAGLLITILALAGAIFCIIPGIVIAILYLPTFFIMSDDGLDFWPAMEKSRTVVWNNFAQWALLSLALFVLNLIGSIPCGLGLLVTAPMSLVVIAKAYELEFRSSRRVPPPLAE